MRKGDYIFVYGTLMRGERMDLAKNVITAPHVIYIGPDKVNGNLFMVGPYPGLKTEVRPFDPRLPVVLGEIFMIRDASVTSFLDSYEGYVSDAPEEGLYNRFVVSTYKGRKAWVYHYNPPVKDEQFIETGDWRNPRLPFQHNRLQIPH